MKYLNIITFTILLILTSCTTEVVFEDLATIEIDKDQLIANGTDTAVLTITFNEEASIENIKAKAEIKNGIFSSSGNTKIDITPVRQPEGGIVAAVDVKSTTTFSDIIVTVNINEYELTQEIESVRSYPKKVQLSASAFSVSNNFGSEITFTANLTNENGRKVSSGIKVKFDDMYDDGNDVNGIFREESLTTGAESNVSAIYTPGVISPEVNINIRVIVLDDEGNETDINDVIQVFVNDNNN